MAKKGKGKAAKAAEAGIPEVNVVEQADGEEPTPEAAPEPKPAKKKAPIAMTVQESTRLAALENIAFNRGRRATIQEMRELGQLRRKAAQAK